MTPADNVYYFDPPKRKIDIRLCLKNGYTSLRTAWVWSEVNPMVPLFKQEWDIPIHGNDIYADILKRKGGIHCDGIGSTRQRYKQSMMMQDIFDIPFRRNSHRIAIKRDPVKRFLSTFEYLKKARNHKDYGTIAIKDYIDLSYMDNDNVDYIIECLENGKLKDEHFFPQSYFMGHRDQYHKVYDIQDLSVLLQEINSWGVIKNQKVADLKQNTSEYKQKIILTPEQEARIIKLYAQDYANGWY